MAARSQVLYDKDIREPLFDFLEETYGKIRILEEKRTGSARADVVMITPDYLYGIEIKSDADTYARLEKQVKNYDWFYDRNIIVAGSTHAAHVREHVPEWWGIITVEPDEIGKTDFYVLREASDNPKVKEKRKITILWRTELNHLLEKNSLPKYKEKSKLFVQNKILEKIPEEILWKQAYEELFERDYTTIEQEIEEFRKTRNKSRTGKDRRRKSCMKISDPPEIAFQHQDAGFLL